jgi:hypothetical protein
MMRVFVKAIFDNYNQFQVVKFWKAVLSSNFLLCFAGAHAQRKLFFVGIKEMGGARMTQSPPQNHIVKYTIGKAYSQVLFKYLPV